jgi:hypothetical protein
MTRRRQWFAWAVIVAGMVFLLQSPLGVRAQDVQDSNAQDPPSRVARLSYMQGSVSFQPGGENDWVTGMLNRPLATGDNLWADQDSRAEVHLGSTALRLGSRTGITLLELSDGAAQIRLAQGSLTVRARHVDDQDSYEIDTPNVAFVVVQPGEYRIDVDPDGHRTEVTVWRGRGEVTGGGSSYTVYANQYAAFTGNDHLDYAPGQIPDQDGFGKWAFERDQTEDRSDSSNYVSREMTGYEDFDQYGDWSYVAGYGNCWQPRALVAGWAPYRFGHWTWVAPWGWTWVEDEPWGFAPFHYGRWAFSGTGWYWVPGPNLVRPAYSPALVGWIGGGAGFRFSNGVGVGWFPLAPGEVFVPGYRVSRAYVNRVNITNTAVNVTRVANVYNTVVVERNVNNITYANRNVSGGVTVVSHDTFVNSRPVGRNVVSVSAKELAAAPASHEVVVEPVRGSVFGAGKPVARPPDEVTSRPVVALRTPASTLRSSDHGPAVAGEHSSQAPLVRQQAPGRPVPTNPTPQPHATQVGFHALSESSGGENGPAKPQPRVWEAQGTPEPERSTQAQKRNAQPAQNPSHAQAKPAAPVQQKSPEQERPQERRSSAAQQKPAPAPKPAATPHSSAPPKPAAPAKK